MATQNPYSNSLLMDAFRGSLSNAESLGRGFAVAPVGLLGDINALARQYVTPRLPQGVQSLLQSAPAAPTTEQILSNIPRVSNPRMETAGMEQLGAAMNPRGPIELAKAVKNMPVGLSIKDVGSFKFPQEEAMRLAQQRAALPKEQGGLGLLSNNTADERAAAMGFDTDVLHGTAKDFPKFDMNMAGVNTRQSGDELGIFSTSKPFLANNYAEIASKGGWANRTQPEGAVVYPLKANLQSPKRFDTATGFYREADPRAANQSLGDWRNELQSQGYDSVIVRPDLEEVVAFNPDQLRSRFAAFDPFRRTAATAAAMGVSAPDLLAQEKPVITQQQIDDEMAMYGLLGR